MLRILLAALAVVLLVPVAQAGGAHGPYVEGVSHEPASPKPGQDVTVTVRAATDAEISSIVLTHCRVEPSYACSVKTDSMTAGDGGAWTGVVPWQVGFFDGTRWVGYNLIIATGDGNESKAPIEDVPETPDGLPEDAGHYYFYTIDAKAIGTPGPGLVALLVVLLIGGMLRRRHAT
jgi:hypothetical protein